ncbi:hypothetical protein SK803_28320 [Lentzea sp. BCCO 10_0856]|uniref:Uncharacterized protein n=1 Tax=Lentzea miocenica TaxID=3095431 RepID=A0ABU4T7K2_9PSEU|nr:hypothetical protein [Lentzea sp. BCCO 10_0856]MDX8034142.1 hypothetical protein [Lentzea sp. BCCO 10_0856]
MFIRLLAKVYLLTLRFGAPTGRPSRWRTDGRVPDDSYPLS